MKFKLNRNSWWNLHHELAQVILGGLRQFKDADRHGAPASFFPFDEDWPVKLTAEQDAACYAAWEIVLNKMILAFGIIYQDEILRSPEQQRVVEEGLALFAAHFEQLWD